MSRTSSFLVLLLIYIAGAALGFYVCRLGWGGGSPEWNLFIADVAATVFVWLWGLIFKNVSVYDPYWSVAPPVMLTACAFAWNSFSLPVCLMLVAVWVWAIRLTGNWAFTFRGIAYEDWRYTKYRTGQPAFIFQVINFFGLNMMPTVVVFLCMLPGIGMTRCGVAEAGVLTWIGFAVSIGAASLQLVAGPVLMTCMFRFISVPLMEHRQLKNKPAYAEYVRTTPMFLRWKRR